MSVIGVDGCKAGWLWVRLGTEAPSYGIADPFEILLDIHPSPAAIFVDIPVGLRTAESQERVCDLAARKVLGQPRASSVFPAPCRLALRESTHSRASKVNKRQTGRGLPIQAFSICSKINEIDELLHRRPEARAIIREVHPEVLFWALNAKRPMLHAKKTKEGLKERLECLSQHLPAAYSLFQQIKETYPRKKVALDDIADALAAALTASFGPSRWVTIPNAPERDASNLPMEMVYGV